MGVASLVLGIISIVGGAFGLGILTLVCGIVGIILGALGRKDPEKAGMANAGLVLSIIGSALSLVVWIACAACISAAGLGSMF